jgi:hypothetical protein
MFHATVARNLQCRRTCQRLVHHAIPLGQPKERGQLLLRGVGVQGDLQPNTLKADWNLTGAASALHRNFT